MTSLPGAASLSSDAARLPLSGEEGCSPADMTRAPSSGGEGLASSDMMGWFPFLISSFAGQSLERDKDGLEEVRPGSGGARRGEREQYGSGVLCPFDSCAQGTTTICSWDGFQPGAVKRAGNGSASTTQVPTANSLFSSIRAAVLPAHRRVNAFHTALRLSWLGRRPGEEKQADACMGGLFGFCHLCWSEPRQ